MSKGKGRSKAFFVNGGAGRVLCSIPAFEKYEEESGDEDFIIVCEGGMDFFKGHPTLHRRAYDNWHKGLYQDYLKTRDIVTTEPYRIWEYYNQKATLTEAFDIDINGRQKDGNVRSLDHPKLVLTKEEQIIGYQAVQEVKANTGKDQVLVVQPFGRGVAQEGPFIFDSSSRSFELSQMHSLLESLRTKYAIIVMSEIPFPMDQLEGHEIAQPSIQDMRIWSAVIQASDHFLGCDSVGQHIAKALLKTATVVVGSTYPENITYTNSADFDIIDVGKDNDREYDPIRLTMDDVPARMNEKCMTFSDEHAKKVVQSVVKRMGKPRKFKGEFLKTEHNAETCTNPDHNHGAPETSNQLADTKEEQGKRQDQAFAQKPGGKKQKIRRK